MSSIFFNLSKFDNKKGFVLGKSKFIFIIWVLLRYFFFTTEFPWPVGLKIFLLKLFGAKIGIGVNIQQNVNIHIPWKLKIGNYSWIGQGSLILNFEPVLIGDNTAIAHRVFICTGNHDYNFPDYPYKNESIKIGSGVAIGSNAVILPGVTIGDNCIITANCLIKSDLLDNSYVVMDSEIKIKIRKFE